jgi:hypothetical protein
MADGPRNTPQAKDWRFPLAIGLTIGLALPIARDVEHALEPSLGYWGAFAVCTAVAGVVGGLVALAVYWLIKPGGPRLGVSAVSDRPGDARG